MEKSNTSLFIFHDQPYVVLVYIYMDDILVTGSSGKVVDDLITKLSFKFSLKVLGHLYYILGWR